ncbi:MAG: polysaccharide biosynthesis tyrosine autokinase [Deferrisomatales bacterium]|nr:polysaccharide biosynthesis tyrosine autokinase [Deferrisomatales bacterium]
MTGKPTPLPDRPALRFEPVDLPGRFPETDDETIDLRELLRKLNRRKGAMAGVFLLVLVAVALYVFQAVPRYTAEARLILDLRQSKVVDVEAVLSGMPKDVAALRSEIDVIRSRTLLERAAGKLALHRDPEFNPELPGAAAPPLAQTVKGWAEPVREWLQGLWLTEAVEPTPEERERSIQRGVVDRLAARLEVDNPRQSYTINLSFTAQSPERAAEVVNAVAELYLTDQMEAKYEATRRANSWLAERLETLRGEVNAAELAVQEMRRRGDLVQARGATVLEQQIADLNAQLVMARVTRSQAEARLRSAQGAVARAGDAASLGDVLASPIIQRLRGEESSLQRREAELSQRYGHRHPEMIKINAELADVRSKMAEETGRVVESLVNEVEVTHAKERSLQASLNELREQTAGALHAEVELRELERHAQSARVLYESFLERFRETGEQESLYRPDARVVSWAEPPERPSYPRKALVLGLGAVAALMLAVMAAFLLETLDRGFRTGDQVEQLTGVPVLGMIPALGTGKGRPENYVLEKPFSSFAESLRGIRTAIQLSNVDQPPKTVLVTSSLPREGKSTFCLALGRMAAASGTKTIVVDADLRRPVQAEKLPEARSLHKLEEVLTGASSVRDAVGVDAASGLHVLAAHGKTPAAAELLGSRRMAKLISELAKIYDLVLVDTPPVMGVSDAWPLTRAVDAVLFVVRWAETPRETVRAALRQMEALNIRVNGVVLDRVNVRRQAKYGYGAYGYYYGRYRKYYRE